MSFAFITDKTIRMWDAAVPQAARRLDNQQWVLGLREAIPALQQACGWFAITETAQPANTATHTSDRSLELVAGIPTVVWTVRLKTEGELATETSTVNNATIKTQALIAFNNNRTYLAIATPTNAQVAAQVKALTRQMNSVIRLLVATSLNSDTTID